MNHCQVMHQLLNGLLYNKHVHVHYMQSCSPALKYIYCYVVFLNTDSSIIIVLGTCQPKDKNYVYTIRTCIQNHII